MTFTLQQAGNITGNHFFRYWMPYLFHHLSEAPHKHVYLPLNRSYKPLGQIGSDHVDYYDFLQSAVRFRCDPAKFEEVWHNVTPGALFLYDDALPSRTDYLLRLERLLKKSMPIVGSGKA